MSKQKILRVKNRDLNGTINEFLKEILRSGKLSALLVPQEVTSKKAVFPTLVSDADKLNANVFAPLLSISTAKIVSKITKFQPPAQPIGVVMHPCQIRALIELVKLNQANLTNVIIIGIDCPGTLSINAYAELSDKEKHIDLIINDVKSNKLERYLRPACVVCDEPIPNNVDLLIGIFGVDVNKEILIETFSNTGDKLIDNIKLDAFKDKEKREKFIKDLIENRKKKLESFIKEKTEKFNFDFVVKFFDKCINCHNCMNVCPICYCKECLFESSVFDAEAYRYIKKAESKGSFKLPDDSLLFHLGRMNHMVLSCVKCGLCEQSCPTDIHLMDIIIPIAERAQKEFNYLPGRDIKEKIPAIVYQEKEYLEVGEK